MVMDQHKQMYQNYKMHIWLCFLCRQFLFKFILKMPIKFKLVRMLVKPSFIIILNVLSYFIQEKYYFPLKSDFLTFGDF